MGAVIVAPERLEQAEVRLLFAEADARSESLYPAESRHGLSVEALAAASAVLFVAREGGTAIGCGGFVLEGDGSAELKRIFVRRQARGRGVGAALMHSIEAAAIDGGADWMRLETGIKSLEALSLYRRFGYSECGPFGRYAADPLSVFMEKRLARGREEGG